jgi:hypothetical membrane protein
VLAGFAIVAQIVFVGGWFAGGALEPRFSQVSQFISELGREGAANPGIFTAFMTVWGLGLFALAAAIVPSLRTRPWPLGMPVCFMLAGVCAIAVGQLQMDCSPILSAACKSREATGELSGHHYAHEWISLGIKVSLLATGFAFARSAWPSRLGRLVLGGALVLLVAGIVTFLLHNSFVGYKGLEERVWALVAVAWALLCAVVLILEATLQQSVLSAHEAAAHSSRPGQRALASIDPA